MEQASDLELARLSRGGDESAFSEIVRRHGPRVFRTASRFFRRRELVEEAAQETFLKAFTELASFEGRGSFEGWLTRVATNTCLNLLRSASRRPESSLSDLTEDEGAWLDSHTAGAARERHEAAERGLAAADLADRVLDTLSPDDRLVGVEREGARLPRAPPDARGGRKVNRQAVRGRGRRGIRRH